MRTPAQTTTATETVGFRFRVWGTTTVGACTRDLRSFTAMDARGSLQPCQRRGRVAAGRRPRRRAKRRPAPLAIDDHSRLAYAELLSGQSPRDCVAFVRRAACRQPLPRTGPGAGGSNVDEKADDDDESGRATATPGVGG